MEYTSHFSTKKTNQKQPIPGRKDMVENNAGGFVFQVDAFDYLRRFLILGTEGGTYYVKEQKLTVEGAKNTIACIQKDGLRVVGEIIDVSEGGKAVKNGAAIFALALCMTYGDPETKAAAYEAIPVVCRIGTHLFDLCQCIQDLRGWSRGLRTAVSQWYAQENITLQLVKYRQRNGWTHRDVLRLCHAKPQTPEQKKAFEFAVKGVETDLPLVQAFFRAQEVKEPKQWVSLITEHRLPREALPTEALKEKKVWEALNQHMPITATLRNLAKMTSVGLLELGNTETKRVIERITNKDVLKKGRVHPISILIALKTYAQGHGDKGSLTWTPVQKIVDALDEAFYLSFDAVEPCGKDLMLGLDISGSMDGSRVAGTPLTAREACAAMAMVTARTEKNAEMLAFATKPVEFRVGVRDRLDTVVNNMRRLVMGGTDCSAPILYALGKRLPTSGFIIYTDSETWVGFMHPAQALAGFRQKVTPDAKMVVVATAAMSFTIADPKDKGMLDVVGFDPSTPQVISEFIRG